MNAKQNFLIELQDLIKEIENHGADAAMFAAQEMHDQAVQVQTRNTKMPVTVKRPVSPVFH